MDAMRDRGELWLRGSRGRRWCFEACIERRGNKWVVSEIGALDASLFDLRKRMQLTAQRVGGEGIEVAVEGTGPGRGAGRWREIKVKSLEPVLAVYVVCEEAVVCIWHLADVGHVSMVEVRYPI